MSLTQKWKPESRFAYLHCLYTVPVKLPYSSLGARAFYDVNTLAIKRREDSLPLELQVHQAPAPNHLRIPLVPMAYLGRTSKQLRITRAQHQRNNQAEGKPCLVLHVYILQERTCPECRCLHVPVHHSCVALACPTNRHMDRGIGA
jgi:hypothetical protein